MVFSVRHANPLSVGRNCWIGILLLALSILFLQVHTSSCGLRGNYALVTQRLSPVLSKLGYFAADCWAMCLCVCRETGREAVHGAVREAGLLLQRGHLPSYDVTQQKVLRVSNDVRVIYPRRETARDEWDGMAEKKRDMKINRIRQWDREPWPKQQCSSFVPQAYISWRFGPAWNTLTTSNQITANSNAI